MVLRLEDVLLKLENVASGLEEGIFVEVSGVLSGFDIDSWLLERSELKLAFRDSVSSGFSKSA